jgi:hypothetical protein
MHVDLDVVVDTRTYIHTYIHLTDCTHFDDYRYMRVDVVVDIRTCTYIHTYIHTQGEECTENQFSKKH